MSSTSDESERVNNKPSKYTEVHQQLFVLPRKKCASTHKMYTVYDFLKSTPIHHQPSPSTPVLTRPKEDTLWYYREMANAFQSLLLGQLAEELMEIVIVLENE